MNIFFIVGGVLLIMAYLIGIKKQTWLLSGFNEQRVSNKTLLANIVGGFYFVMSLLFIANGLLAILSEKSIFAVLIIGLFGLIVYTNTKLVERK